MSGVCGIYSPRAPERFSSRHLAAMIASLQGSEGEFKVFADQAGGIGLGLAHTRGFPTPQEVEAPVWLEDDGAVVALAGTLDAGDGPGGKAAGAVAQAAAVRSHYESTSERFPLGLDGVFSLAVWHKTSRRLTVATDVFGSRPVYYYHEPDTGYFAFASELGALLCLPVLARKVDPQGVGLYIRLGFIPAPWTIFSRVRKALHFEKLVLDPAGRLTSSRYYSLPGAEPGPVDLDFWVPRVRDEIVAAVGRMTRRTAALGVLLSGGVDSTVMLAALSELGASKVTAFTLSYQDVKGQEDDLFWARRAAEAAGAKHVEVVVRQSDLTSAPISMVLQCFEEPADTFSRGLTQNFLTAALHRHGIRSCLAGHAGDQVFGSLRSPGMQEENVSGADEEQIARLFADMRLFFSEEGRRELMLADFDGGPVLKQVIEGFLVGMPQEPGFKPYTNAGVFRIRTGAVSLPGQRISGLNSVEERAGFADRRLLEFAQAIPAALRGPDRVLLRSAFSHIAPMLMDVRQKRSFPGTPRTSSQSWLGPLVVRQVERAAGNGILRPEAVRKILRKYLAGKGKRPMISAWHIFVLQTWLDFHVNDFNPFEQSMTASDDIPSL